MSMKCLAEVWASRRPMPPNQKLILLYLADDSDEIGRSVIDYDAICAFTGLSAQKLQWCLDDMEGDTIVTRRARDGALVAFIRSTTGISEIKNAPSFHGMSWF